MFGQIELCHLNTVCLLTGPEIKLLEAVEDNILPWLDHVVEINSGKTQDSLCITSVGCRQASNVATAF